MRSITSIIKGHAAVIAGMAFLFLASGAIAEMPIANHVLRDTVTVGDKQVPLPRGPWIVAASAYEPLPQTAPATAAAVAEAVLLQVNRGRVDAFILIQTNAIPAPGDWGLARDCTRPDIHHAAIQQFKPGSGGTCSFVNHVVMATDLAVGSAWDTASRLAASRGWILPATWLVAGFRVSDEEDTLDVRYFFNPAILSLPEAPAQVVKPPSSGLIPTTIDWLRGQAHDLRGVLARPPQRDPRWEGSEWAPARVADDEPRQQAVAGLVRWSETMRTPVRRGLRKQIAGMPAPAMPWSDDGAPAPPETALRLRRLEDLRGAGAIPEEQYRELRALLLGDGAEAADTLPWTLSLWKTISWRALGSSLDLIVSYLFTGSLGTAGGITVIGGMVNSAAYYGHELTWSLLGRGLPPPMRLVDFATVGIDG